MAKKLPKLPVDEPNTHEAFVQSGRSQSTTPTHQTAPEHATTENAPSAAPEKARPAQKTPMHRIMISLPKEHFYALEDTSTRWRRQTSSGAPVSITGQLRALLAAALPVLEELEHIPDEETLARVLAERLARR